MALPQPKPWVLAIPLYEPGKSQVRGVSRVIKLSSNEAALGPSPKALAAYDEAKASVATYPPGTSPELKAALAEVHGLDPARFSATSLRVGHTVQTDTLSDFEQMRDTGHFSKSGKIAYLRASLQQAQKTAKLLTDTEYHTLPMVKLQSGC